MYQNTYYNNASGQPRPAPVQQAPLYGPVLKGRPVASLEEVRATGIDFDGSVFYFPDLANKRIYTKQIAMDGTAQLQMYELKPLPEFQPNAYVTKEELQNIINQLREQLAAAPAATAAMPQTTESEVPASPPTSYQF